MHSGGRIGTVPATQYAANEQKSWLLSLVSFYFKSPG